MTQMSFFDAEYAGKRKQTRREIFLSEMEQVVPWDALLSLIELVYPKAGKGRRPDPMSTMLRVHLRAEAAEPRAVSVVPLLGHAYRHAGCLNR